MLHDLWGITCCTLFPDSVSVCGGQIVSRNPHQTSSSTYSGLSEECLTFNAWVHGVHMTQGKSSVWMNTHVLFVKHFPDHFQACVENREEGNGMSCWTWTQRSLVKETQHSRPLRPIPRTPNTQQYIFLQFCGFSTGQQGINACWFRQETIP